MRGATPRQFACRCGRGISIHAPHARSDDEVDSGVDECVGFQSTLLMRGATSKKISCILKIIQISIHAPHARSDAGPHNAAPVMEISIHAPHARSDILVPVFLVDILISIHAPHARSDLMSWHRSLLTVAFQSTLLMRGATWGLDAYLKTCKFQSTLLMRGAT